jgi:hypothetical protein
LSRRLFLAVAVAVPILACSVFAPAASQQTTSASPTAIPGWVRFEGGGAEIWLPPSFVGGDPAADVDVIVDTLTRLGPEFQQAAEAIRQNPSLYALIAYEANPGPSGFLTNVNIVKETVLSGISIDAYLDAIVAQLPAGFDITSRELTTLNGREAGRMVIAFAVAGIEGKQLLYTIREGGTMWSITFTAAQEEFESLLPAFDSAASTFNPHP